jgi:hypothetical protein
MIQFKQANEAALDYLKDMESEIRVTLQIVKIREESFGWVFFYQSKKYMETEDFSEMLAGNAPFLIDKKTADLHVLGTAQPADYYIEEYAC